MLALTYHHYFFKFKPDDFFNILAELSTLFLMQINLQLSFNFKKVH